MKNRKKFLTLLLSATLLLSPFQNGLGSAKPAWGAEYGASGPSVTADNRQSEPIGEGNEVASVFFNGLRNAAVTKSGDLYCWGKNNHGQVGDASKEDQTTPVKILENASSVSLGSIHSAAVTKSGDLYCWGWNDHGEVGDASKEDQTAPVKVLENVSSVSLGVYHSAAVTKSGDLYCWGWNDHGEVGNGSKEDQTTPVKVLENVSSVSLGFLYSAAVTKSGDLYCWGWNNHGEVGNGSKEDQTTPVKVLENVSSVSLGDGHSAAVTKSGDLYCWGKNDQGEVGNGSKEDQTTPVKILENVSSVSLGVYHSAAVTKSSDLYCWGDNYNGEVGNGSKEDQTTPVKILENVSSVSLERHSAAVTKSGDLFCWGYNGRGQVGNGSKEDQATPVKVLENVSSVSLGVYCSAAVTKSGDLFCWGRNECGGVGNGSKEDQTTPVKVLGNMSSAATTTESPSATPEPTPSSTHTHDYGVNWKNDATSHWHECDCGEKADKAEHTEDSGTVTKEPTETETGLRTYKCSVCGYVTRTEEIAVLPPSHTHAYGTDWKSDAIAHWKECSCGEKTENADHTEDAGTVTKEPTETETGIKTYKCVVCGYVTRTEEIAVLPPFHIHTYGTGWKSDAIAHWKECTCGEKTENAAHTEDAGTVTKEPTETETGLRTYKCVVCGYVTRTEEIAVLPPSHTHVYETNWKSDATTHWKECSCGEKTENAAHTEDTGTVTKEATETETGIRTYKCVVCGYVTRTEEIAVLPPSHTHVYGTDWKSDIMTHWKECSCGEKKENVAHTEDTGTVTKEATETETGIRTYKCTVCDYVMRTEEIAVLPPSHTHVYETNWKSDATAHWKECSCGEKTENVVHTEDAGTVTKEATETETGIRTYKCVVCESVTRTEEIAVLPPSHTHVYGTDWKSDIMTHWKECSCGEKKENVAHTEDVGTVTKEATETETGIRTYKCVVCGYITRTEEIAVLPPSHTHVYGTDWKSDTMTHWKECSCGEKKENVAHTEDAGTVTKEATETETGIRTYKCVVCGYVTRTEEIAVLPPSHTHTYGTDWKSNADTHWKECSCGEKKDNVVHTEDAGTVTKEATETETGIRTYKCVVCGYVTRTEEIEKHAEGLFEKGNETTTEVETPPEATDIPEDDRITSITINPAFNMKHKDGSDVELDLSKIEIKAKEIYDEAGLKRAEAALGETLNGNKKYNLLDLTLLYNGKDFSNGYVGLVKVIIPLPKGHRDKTFSCYRLIDGKKELIPGEQTEDSYIIYLEHFSEYALVAEGPEEPAEPAEPHTHVYSTAWKSDATGHWKECACNDKAEESVHTQDVGTVTKEATKAEPGIKAYRCSVCGYLIKTEEIAILSADEEPINKKIPDATIVTKAQKKKNEIIINKKVSFKIISNSLVVTWNKLSGADGYDIYVAFCGDDFKGITASVGKNKSSSVVRKLNGMKINGGKTYKVQIKAYRLLQDGKKQYIGTSAVMHVAGSQNKTTTNVKNISLKKKAYALKKGKSAKICATIIKADKKKELLSKMHTAELSYVSSDETIATVTATGKIKAKKRGKCIIYVRALNGISKKIKVTVN